MLEAPKSTLTGQTKQSVHTLLLVEDDPTISELLAHNLRTAGYEVLVERDGQAGLESAMSYQVDLVILDLMLPELDGLTVSREISRRKPELPIIMLTARDERESALEGFEAGADDYVTKPFDLDQLLARIAARLRRASRQPQADGAPVSQTPAPAGLQLDSNARTARGLAGETPLNPKEHDLLELLLSEPGHLFRREELVHRVWHQPFVSTSRSLDVHVRHLRVKLEEIGASVTIQTVRGVGYRVVSTEAEPTIEPGAAVTTAAEPGDGE